MNELLIVFDLDGVIVDSAHGIRCSVDIALAQASLEPLADDEVPLLLGPPIADGLGEVLMGRRRDVESDDLAALVAVFRQDYATRSLETTMPYQGVVAALELLRRRCAAVALATSKPRPATTALLEHLGISPFLDPIECPEEHSADTKADVLARVLRGTGHAPERTVMIGDRWHDMHAAKLLGCRRVGALWGYGSVAELIDAGAETTADSPDRLLDAIGALP